MTAALDVAVTRRIGEFDLDVAFTMESGISVLFGPSGAGKSLTLALIAGLIRPDAGTILINGRVVTDCARRIHVSTQERRIGMVFQDGVLLPHRSVLDNVALAVRQAGGRRERRAIARSWLERVGAEGFVDRRPGSLSGGQRQRVALARGLAGEPALVLLDEPLSALDATVRAELRELIREVIPSSGVPALLVTHDAEEAADIGDVIIAYDDGRVTGRRVVERPVPPRTRDDDLPQSGAPA
jgi:molybdate transport system ATP-binding protein